ncbi:hypothetical protein TNCV_3310521 [Trichonephila clavipes]|nr:hypothetical protein TNCV_3310521 [Trichonephila clavipes]
MGAAIPYVLQPGAFIWFEKPQGPPVKVLLVTMKHLAVRRLVCRGHPEPGLRVNVISRIHWSQHLLTTQSERPN